MTQKQAQNSLRKEAGASWRKITKTRLMFADNEQINVSPKQFGEQKGVKWSGTLSYTSNTLGLSNQLFV